MKNPYRGTSFGDWLHEEGIYDEVKAPTAQRIKSGSYGPDEIGGGDFSDLTKKLEDSKYLKTLDLGLKAAAEGKVVKVGNKPGDLERFWDDLQVED